MSFSSSTTRLFVSCAGSLEPLLAAELRELGIRGVEEGFRGVYVPKSIENVYMINYTSRLATRVLWPLRAFPCPDKEALYKGARAINWDNYLNVDSTFSIDANVTPHPTIKNSHFAALVVKDAICDQQRDLYNKRSSVALTNPDLQLNLFLHRGKATLYLDTSGQPLYKRGYRTMAGAAPLQESLAAAILRVSKYDPEKDLLADPFAGSGTLLIEAAMIATNTPAGFFRSKWGFERMPEFSEEVWKAGRKSRDDQRKPLPKDKLFGSDQDPAMVDLARKHLDSTGFGNIDILTRSIARYRPSSEINLIVTNPPYGERIEREKNLYNDFTTFLAQTSLRAAYFLVPVGQRTPVPARRVFSCLNGGLEVDLLEHLPLLVESAKS